MQKFCYVSCISNMNYMPGVLALHYSLELTRPRYPFKVMIPENADPRLAETLSEHGIDSFTMPRLEFPAEVTRDNKIGYWTESLFKLNVFRLKDFDKIVYLDADMIVLNSIDELFERPHLSGVIAGQTLYPRWDGLNSGMMVIVPAINNDFEGLLDITPKVVTICREKNHGFGDQNVINHYFTSWKYDESLHLPETYNALYGLGTTPFFNSIAERYHVSIDQFKILHFIGRHKPWDRQLLWKLVYLFRMLIHFDVMEYRAWRLYVNMLKHSGHGRRKHQCGNNR